MIGIQIQDEFLDIDPDTSFTIEIANPLFGFDDIPGIVSYPINIKSASARNRRLTGFPDLIESNEVKAANLPCRVWLEGLMWKVGTAVIRGASNRSASLNFTTDAGNLQQQIKDATLKDLITARENIPLPITDTLNVVAQNFYPSVNYAAFPVYNPKFYDEKVPEYNHYLNYYNNGFSFVTSPLVPFPYVLFVLQSALQTLGYKLTGSWTTDPEIRQLVLINAHALENRDGLVESEIVWRNHVPDMKLGTFLINLQKLFCLGYIIDPVAKTFEVVPLKEVLASPHYIDLTRKASVDYAIDPNESNGFTLQMQVDDTDEYLKTISTDGYKYKVDGGKESFETAFSPLELRQSADAGRFWETPQVHQKGNTPLAEVGTLNKTGTRLMFYRGLWKDSAGNTYPLGSSRINDYPGSQVGNYSLTWAGTHGLYNTWWKPYLEFLKNTRPVEREVQLSLGDILSLDYKKKWMIDSNKFFFRKITLTISQKTGIKTAKVSLLKTKL